MDQGKNVLQSREVIEMDAMTDPTRNRTHEERNTSCNEGRSRTGGYNSIRGHQVVVFPQEKSK